MCRLVDGVSSGIREGMLIPEDELRKLYTDALKTVSDHVVYARGEGQEWSKITFLNSDKEFELLYNAEMSPEALTVRTIIPAARRSKASLLASLNNFNAKRQLVKAYLREEWEGETICLSVELILAERNRIPECELARHALMRALEVLEQTVKAFCSREKDRPGLD